MGTNNVLKFLKPKPLGTSLANSSSCGRLVLSSETGKNIREPEKKDFPLYISRRINRIFVAFAVIAMIPGYHIGENVYKEMFRTAVYGRSLELYVYPANWQGKLVGAAVALLVFFVVLVGLRLSLKLSLTVLAKFKGNRDMQTDFPR